MKIEEILINSNIYPEKLKKIYDSPKKLYVLGNKELLYKKSIAIVGARKASDYGKKVAFDISKRISEKGIIVISGLAKGIDAYSHIGAIHNSKNNNICCNTIAVLGSGIDVIYPKENIQLAREIIKRNGCIVSEYPLGSKPERNHFPQRNRIISGLSDGVIVVEAGSKSGALITAEFALEQGKDVFAVPGDIIREQSKGCNDLINDGAFIITSYDDIDKCLI